MPVHDEDVGSIISAALLSSQTQEQMAPLWQSLTNGRSCCPLAKVPDGNGPMSEASCFASMPECLRSNTVLHRHNTARGCGRDLLQSASRPSTPPVTAVNPS